jgi:hypothetical protein
MTETAMFSTPAYAKVAIERHILEDVSKLECPVRFPSTGLAYIKPSNQPLAALLSYSKGAFQPMFPIVLAFLTLGFLAASSRYLLDTLLTGLSAILGHQHMKMSPHL